MRPASWMPPGFVELARDDSGHPIVAIMNDGTRKGSMTPYLPTMCAASLSMQTYSPISSFVSRSATLLMTQGFE